MKKIIFIMVMLMAYNVDATFYTSYPVNYLTNQDSNLFTRSANANTGDWWNEAAGVDLAVYDWGGIWALNGSGAIMSNIDALQVHTCWAGASKTGCMCKIGLVYICNTSNCADSSTNIIPADCSIVQSGTWTTCNLNKNYTGRYIELQGGVCSDNNVPCTCVNKGTTPELNRFNELNVGITTWYNITRPCDYNATLESGNWGIEAPCTYTFSNQDISGNLTIFTQGIMNCTVANCNINFTSSNQYINIDIPASLIIEDKIFGNWSFNLW